MCFTLEPCNFTLNIFQDFVFTYFKQDLYATINFLNFQDSKQGQKSPLILTNAGLLFGRSFVIETSLKSRSFRRHCRSCLKYVNTKSWNIFKVKWLQGSKVKRTSQGRITDVISTLAYIRFQFVSWIVDYNGH